MTYDLLVTGGTVLDGSNLTRVADRGLLRKPVAA
jgi:hypothetical protein